jgi:hypothetical protein
VPSIQQVPFDCGKAVAAVLGATAQALSTDDPDAAANQVRAGLLLVVSIRRCAPCHQQQHSKQLRCNQPAAGHLNWN